MRIPQAKLSPEHVREKASDTPDATQQAHLHGESQSMHWYSIASVMVRAALFLSPYQARARPLCPLSPPRLTANTIHPSLCALELPTHHRVHYATHCHLRHSQPWYTVHAANHRNRMRLGRCLWAIIAAAPP